jgi:hypothetical protein
MFGPRKFHYLVDGMTEESAVVLRKSLTIIPDVKTVHVSPGRSMIEVEARRDVADQVRLACEVAGVHYRTRARL